MNSLPTIPLFPPGRLVATPGALACLWEVILALGVHSGRMKGKREVIPR